MVQQSAASAEELATSANELTNQAEDQRDAMSFFTLAEGQGASTPTATGSERRSKKSSGSKPRGQVTKLETKKSNEASSDDGFDYDFADDAGSNEFVKY